MWFKEDTWSTSEWQTTSWSIWQHSEKQNKLSTMSIFIIIKQLKLMAAKDNAALASSSYKTTGIPTFHSGPILRLGMSKQWIVIFKSLYFCPQDWTSIIPGVQTVANQTFGNGAQSNINIGWFCNWTQSYSQQSFSNRTILNVWKSNYQPSNQIKP